MPPPPPPAGSPNLDKIIVKRSEEVIRGLAILRYEPEYPQLAYKFKIEGKVVVEITIDESGNTVFTKIISGPILLREASLKAAQRWIFTPFSYNNKAVQLQGYLTFIYTLDNKTDL